MLINLKVKTLDAQTHEFSIDNEITVREFKDKVAEKTNIAADQQRIIYCGRVMVDDKQLKEYDVDGKVVHVAERPPPSQRIASSETSSSNANPPNERRARGRPGAGGMRSSPLFRALDGMVVGTMAFPVNANANGQTPVNPLAASSSFCMNRITVARHMLECANNIAAYLEDPTRGLNNQPLDILARGRWTMESTVVEVGITSDIPQSQQIVEMVQGAVQAALRRSGNTNVTLVQLPTVYSSSEGEANSAASALAASAQAAAANGTETTDEVTANAVTTGNNVPPTSAASVVIEDVLDDDDDDDTPTNEHSTDNNSATGTSPTAAGPSAANDENSAASGTEDGSGDASRRRTGTRVLATVIEQMRNVQTRLNPFIDQYYELLQGEQNFEESDITGRENAQRLYDRVSEAFHYLSHAQHAISDLMLDVSQAAPRYLTCRPILVEQSGYVSSNNFITPAMLPGALRQQQQPSRNATPATATQTNATATSASTSSANNATNRSASTSNISATSNNDANNSAVDDPIDDPVPWPPTFSFGSGPSNDNNAANNNAAGRAPSQSGGAGGGGGTLEIVLQPTRAYYLERNFQRQVARLLQDVVSAAPFETEFHVHINSPNVVSIDVPIGGPPSAAAPSSDNATSASTAATESATPAPADATTTTANTTSAGSSAAANANHARVTTATLPTTSTQTRSTSRPQVHIGNIPVLGMSSGWNGRVLPNSNVSTFDRFLPCNSHHVRDHQSNAANSENASRNANQNIANTPASSRATRANIITRRPLRTMSDILLRMRRPAARVVGSTMTDRSSRTSNNAAPSNSTSRPGAPVFDFGEARREMASRAFNAASSIEARRLNIHSQLMNFIENEMFKGKPINDENMLPVIDRAVQWFAESLLHLQQYEKPEYDSRDSLFNILRTTLPIVIKLMNKNPVNLLDFEQKLREICEQFRKRLYSVLIVCIGRANADIYWSQLMRLLCVSIQSTFNGEVVEFLTLYVNPNIPNSSDEIDAQQFIVHRGSASSTPDNSVQMPMDTDVEMTDVAAGGSQTEVDDEPLPSVVPGSEPWHRNFPNDWLPIITRDIQNQTEHPPSQPPYSDAYISGMSSKRRKLVQHSKPPTEISALIADSVSKAIQNAGVGSSTSANQPQTPDEIARAIANDSSVQSACTESVRINVRERLKKEPDYEPEKFPKSAKFIQK
ncbi:large proline-rich protein bag6-A isoform X2 [Stomoxys calcitrans]|uniref:Large proline-rich protein BAG6 n=1 Tax=Stomoxys calcitrans TaxID=35570 RepID=A0A1I8PRX0_STOCA|nr:large proline-rich protein bag6-A isoform X2 [Stomoxys calcitrans]